ncbi:hypothetical protein ACOMHN_009438 [Nucella lapillus]
MPVCERYEGPGPVKMAQFNNTMPLHLHAPNSSDYIITGDDPRYHDNGVTNHELLGAAWMEEQNDGGGGGGKFRLKRRRRCGQCGPCQVKENCGRCQYCMRKDVLKQACIYRKCIYLRKPVPRFRPEAAQQASNHGGGGGGGGGGTVGPGGSVSGASGNGSSAGSKSSPQKPSTPSATSNHHPVPSPYNPVVPPAAAQPSGELSSCQLSHNPFSLPANSAVVEPPNGCSVDQQRSSMYDTSAVADPNRTYDSAPVADPNRTYDSAAVADHPNRTYDSAPVTDHPNRTYDSAPVADPNRTPSYLPGGPSLDSGRSPALDLGRNTSTADSGFGTGSSMTTSPASSVSKDQRLAPVPSADQYRPPVEPWGPVPYSHPGGFSRPTPWALPAFQSGVAAGYGFNPGANTHYASPLASSCHLGVPDPTTFCQSSPASHQPPPFHHTMPFAHQDFAPHHHPGYSPTAVPPPPPSALQPSMTTPPFYPPPPHIPPSLPNFPSFSQLPSSAGPPHHHHHPSFPLDHHHHPSFPLAPHHHHPHPSMYPANFYPSFRPATEPQIYHAHLPPPPCAPFMQGERFPPHFLPPWREKDLPPWREKDLPPWREKDLPPWRGPGEKRGQEEEEDMRKKFSIFRIPRCKRRHWDLNLGDSPPFSALGLSGKRAGDSLPLHSDWVDVTSQDESNRMLLKTVPEGSIDYDLQQQFGPLSGWGVCDVISIDDFKMHAFIRSDGFNNLEIEIESPVVGDSFHKNQCLPVASPDSCDDEDDGVRIILQQPPEEDVNNNSISPKDSSPSDDDSDDDSESASRQNERHPLSDTDGNDECDDRNDECDDRNDECDDRNDECDGILEGEEGGVREVEVPGSQVRLQDVALSDDLLATSSDPQHLLHFLSQQHIVAPPSPDIVFRFEFDRDPSPDLDPEQLS